MDELVHDLTSALEESELKKEIHDSQLIFSRRRRIRKRRPLCGITQTQEKHINNSIAEDVSYKTDIPKSIELNLTGSDTESGFVLPVIRKHRRKKIKRMETETQICMPTKDRICLNKQVTVMELDYCNHPGMKSVKNRPEFESGISASDDSNEDAEAQDGDDEMTDFYNEPGGSVSGIPAIIPWWDDEKNDEDSKLKNIINNALPELSESAKRSFHARINRLPGMAARSIRRGRRKFKHKKINDKSNTETHGKEFNACKRCRIEDVDYDSLSMLKHAPIPNSNVGHIMLCNMGWNPGEGLGISGQGLQTPITISTRKKRAGFGL